MSILAVLIPISLVLLGIAIAAFVWAVKRGQFDDLETPAIEILADEGEAHATRKNPSPPAPSRGDAREPATHKLPSPPARGRGVGGEGPP